jgi:hypothetical protein
MSWHFSRALVAVYSAANSSGGAPSAQSKSNPMPETCSSPDKTTADSIPSRSGMMCEPSMASRGVAWWIYSLGASRARISPSPEMVPGSQENEAASGVRCPESFARWDRASCSWKTRQCSLLAGLDEWLQTWPRWGMMCAGECWELTMSAHLTAESESGFWPTLVKFDSQNCHPFIAEIENENRLYTISSRGVRATSPLRSWLAAMPNKSAAGKAGWASEPDVGRMVHGVADGVDRIAALGNGQVPAVAALAWRLLSVNLTQINPTNEPATSQHH